MDLPDPDPLRFLKNRTGLDALAYSDNGQRLEKAWLLDSVSNTRFVSGGFNAATAAAQSVLATANGVAWCQSNTWVDAALAKVDAATPSPSRRIAFASDEYFALVDRLAAQQRQGLLANRGRILVRDGADIVLITDTPAP